MCPHGSYGSDGESCVLARGNQGPGLTGSNGNAGPVSAAGLAYDPAAEAYRQLDQLSPVYFMLIM